MANNTIQSHCTKMTTEEAAKISAEKTRIELEKLQENIKKTNAFEKNDYKNPSDVESVTSSSGSTDSVSDHFPKHKNRKQKHISMEDRMYNDNQKLWKKNQELKMELERTSKQLRYLQFEHNNKCLEITNINKKVTDYQIVRSAYFYSRIHLFLCYFGMMMMIVQFKFDIPVAEVASRHVKELAYQIIELAKDKLLKSNITKLIRDE
mgnify:CR=1 FL=1